MRYTIPALLLLTAFASTVRADVTITSGTAVTGLGTAPLYIQTAIGVQGQNLSISGSALSGGCVSGQPNGGTNVITVTFNSTCADSVTGNSLFLGTPLQVVSNGTTYTDGSTFHIVVTMNFTGPAVTAPNVLVGAGSGNYSASVANVPFSMTGSVAVYSGSASGPLIVSIPISGTGLYSGYQYGNAAAGGPGGAPSGGNTYQFKVPSSTQFGLDTATQGAWTGKYGADGYMIANGPKNFPTYSSASVSGQTQYTWAGQTSDPRALNLPGSSNGIASAYLTQSPSQSFTINVGFTDGKTHRVALYALDWDTQSRAETVTITDAASNTVLDSEVLSNFHNGEYATWNLAGNAVITVTSNTGGAAVMSGIFFDPVSGSAPSPSFTLSASAASVAAGSSGASTVTVSPLNGFASTVSLAATGWPAGITGSFTPNPTGTSSNASISVGSSVATGTYSLTVTGTSGSLSATTTIPLTVTATVPSFSISATPVTIGAESFGYSTVTASATVSPVTLSAPGWPTGITAYTGGLFVNTTSVSINVAGGVAPGTYSLPLTATAGTLTASTTIKLTVTAGTPTFTLSATPVTIAAGASGSSTVTATGIVAPESVALATSAWPAGITGTTSTIYGPTYSASVGISVAAGVKPGVYSLTLIGTLSGPQLNDLTTIALTVTGTSSAGSSATYTGLDTTTQGTWTGKYGGDGFLIANDFSSSLPSYATVAVPGSATYTWAALTSDPRALQSAKGFSSGIASMYYGSTFNINVNLTDGNTHQVGLYLLDWDTNSRAEGIVILDAATNTVLDQESFSGFHNGQWAVWNIKGNVIMKVTSNSTNNAVVSGLFFGPASGTAPSPSFTISATPATIAAGSIGSSTVTVNPLNGFISQVSLSTPGWPTGITAAIGVNPILTTGSVAISVAGGVAPGTYSLPLTATSGTLSASTSIQLTVTAGTPLFTLSATPVTIAAGATGSSTVTATWTSSPLPVTLATSGWPTGITGITNTVTPPTNSASVSISVAAGVTPGLYSLTLIGTSTPVSYLTTIALTVTGGSSAGSSATYTGLDTTTQGTWTGKYGGDGFLIANDLASSLPSYATVAVPGSATYTWAALTSDPRALQSGKGFSSGIASMYYGSTFNINFNLTDGNTHQVGLYLLDWDTNSRSEGIVIVDAATNTVLDQESFSGFHNGQWAVWNIKGNVIMKVTSNSTNNAVVSGLFFGPASGTAPSPSFTLSAGAASVAAGSNGPSTVTVSPLNGFASTVSLATTGWPAGITGTFTPNPTGTSSSANISVGSGVATGTYSLTVTGTSGSLSATTTISLTVTAALAPSFTITATAATIATESIGYSTVTVTELNGFASPVGLSAPGWPTGITASIGVNPIVTAGSVAINVAGGVAPGTYLLPLTATAGTLTASTTIKLTVTTGTPLFTLSATPVTIAAGASGSSTVTATWTSSALPVSLVTSGWPTGITGTTNTVTPPTNSASVSISVAAGVTPGVYSLTLIGTSTPVSDLTTIALTVTGSSSASSSATYTGLDTTTQGTWTGKYGADGFLIANDVSSGLPSYATVTVPGSATYTWAALTSDPRALQSGKGFSSGIASMYYGSTFNINVNLTDGNTHQVGLYLLDWDTNSRAEGIVIVDAATNMVLDQESFSGFHNGQWAVWNIKGNVIMKVTSNSTNNAVVSGLFFGPATTGGASYPLTAGLNVAISQLYGSSEVIQADPSSSVVSSSDTVTYLVKWGDGQTNSATVNAPFSHTYTTPGTYTVTLTLSDTGGETSSASQTISTQTVPTSGYGEVVFGANTPTSPIVGLTTTLIVPAKPPATGTLFLWPGLQPNSGSANFNPIGEGVLQPVLTWGTSCAPTTQPAAFSTWWISGQYVNTLGSAPGFTGCFSGPAISVNVGDSLLINMTLSGNVWTQTITDMQTSQTASFNFNLAGQQQGFLFFIIEDSPLAPVTPIQFNNTTFTFASSTGASCFPLNIGVTDTVSAPQIKSNGTQCFVPSITLRAPGIN